MTIDHGDAAASLAAVARTRQRSGELRGYAHAGEIVAAWGLVWLVCNLTGYFAPRHTGNAWLVGIVLGTIWSMWRGGRAGGDKPGWQAQASAATTVGLVILVVLISGVRDQDQVNALISSFVAAGYVSMGIWTGIRFTWIGLAIAAFVVMGWFFDRAHIELWLGIGGGGALLLSGLWLRRA